MIDGHSILHGLKHANWEVAAKIVGNNHASLIGLLVSWWIMSDPDRHTALEGGASFGYRKKGEGGGICDALLCEDDDVVGVLEVEGNRKAYTARKIGKFFAAELEYYETLRFALLLFYPTAPVGRGVERRMPLACNEETMREVASVSLDFPEKAIIVISLEKTYERITEGIRARNSYYAGTMRSVDASLFVSGERVESLNLYCANAKNAV